MKYWAEQRANIGCVWQKRSDPKAFYILIARHPEGWGVTCARTRGLETQHEEMTSRRSDEAGLDECLAFVKKVLSRAREPYFDVAEAKQVLCSVIPQ